MIRSKKAISLIYLACALIGWFIFRELIATIWIISKLNQPVDWMIAPPDIIAAVAALILFVVLIKSEKVGVFTNEAIGELAEVVWPKRKETVLSTGVVSVLVAICAVVLFGFDMIWGVLVKIFYR